MSDEHEPAFTPTPRYNRPRRGKGTNPVLVIVFVLVGAAVLGALGWALFAPAKKDEPKPAEVAKTELPAPGKKANPKHERIVPVAPKEPVPKKSDEVFTDALEEAGKLSDAADLTEPEETRKALAKLTRDEVLASGAFLVANGSATDLAALPPDTPANLKKVGLSAWVSRQSRKIAKGDANFKKVARVLWEPKTGPDGLFAMMSAWGAIEVLTRQEVVRAVEADGRAVNLWPHVRDAILNLGGGAWLER